MTVIIKFLLMFFALILFTNLIFAQIHKPPKIVADIPVLDRKLVEEDLNSGDVSTTVMKSFVRTFTMGGFAKVFTEGEEQTYSFKPKSLSLKDVLDSIVEAEPLYKWNEENGIINILPKDSYSILETRIANFYLKDATKEEMIQALQDQPEFQSAIRKEGVEVNNFKCCGGLCSMEPQRNTIYMANSTVREILNEIVRLNGRSVWRYREFNSTWKSKTKKLYEIDFIINFGADCSAI